MNNLYRTGGWLLRQPNRGLAVARTAAYAGASFSAKIQCRSYFRPSSRGSRFRETKFPYSSNCLTFRHSFSSDSASKSRTGFIGWYLRKLDARPFITKSISSSLIYAAADLTTQMITLPSPGSFDLIRTARIAGYGLLFLGPSQHLWFNYLSRILPKRDVLTTIKKIFMGQALYGPLNITAFFSYNASLQGETGTEIAARLKRDLLPTLVNGLKFWPICDFCTFKFVPVHLQPLVNSSFAYIWTIYLTYMASLKPVDIN